MFAVLPATFALSSYAILDMTFTAFLFGGCALLTILSFPRVSAAAVAVALAVLTKGPLALVLSGLALIISLLVAPRRWRDVFIVVTEHPAAAGA